MENNLLKDKKKSFSFFETALACLIFIILNFVFMQSFYKIPASTISGNIVIPSTVVENQVSYTVTEISDKAFYACSNVQNVTIPNTIQKIGKGVFAGTSLKTIYIPNSVTHIVAPSITEAPFYAVSPEFIIYLEAESVPETFDTLWNYRNTDEPLTIKYGFSFEEYIADAKLTENDLISTDDSQVNFIYNSENNTAIAIKGAEGFSRTNEVVYYIASFLVEALFVLTSFIVVKARKIDFVTANGMNKKISPKLIGIGFLISVVSLYGFSGFTDFFTSLLSYLGYTSSSGSIEMPNFGMYLVYVLISCVTPAICEETLFRGTIQSGLNQFGKKVSILVSSLVFMLMHGSPDQTVHQFIIGCLIGYIFYTSGNLWLGVIIHFFNNFIAVTQMYMLQDLVNTETVAVQVTATDLIASLVYAIISAIAGFYLIKYLINKLLKENEIVNGKQENPKDVSETTTIVVNGETQEVQMSVTGEPTSQNSIDDEAKKEFENDELFIEIQKQKEQNAEELSKTNKKSEVSLASTLMFSLSIGWLVIQWLLALISGF